MKNSKETRTCIGCRKKFNKYELVRLVDFENKIIVDEKQKIKARGAYICKNEECFDKMIKNKRLQRALKKTICEKEYNEIRGVIFDR